MNPVYAFGKFCGIARFPVIRLSTEQFAQEGWEFMGVMFYAMDGVQPGASPVYEHCKRVEDEHSLRTDMHYAYSTEENYGEAWTRRGVAFYAATRPLLHFVELCMMEVQVPNGTQHILAPEYFGELVGRHKDMIGGFYVQQVDYVGWMGRGLEHQPHQKLNRQCVPCHFSPIRDIDVHLPAEVEHHMQGFARTLRKIGSLACWYWSWISYRCSCMPKRRSTGYSVV